MPLPRRLKLIALRIALMLFGLLIALVLGEVILRVAGVAFPLPYVPDDLTGSRLQPGWTGWYTKEGQAFVTINSAGFRDREHSIQKPPDTIRILVLGDSYVEALQVAEQDAFWSVLEDRLHMQFDSEGKRKQIEVISMGVSGWGTAQQWLALQHYGWQYSPDLVLLAFFAGNDIRNNSKELEPDQVRPYFELREGKLVLDDSFRTHPLFQRAKLKWTRIKVAVINRSRVLQAMQEIRGRMKYGREAKPKEKTGQEAGLDEQQFLEPTEESWKRAWAVTENIVRQMNAECREKGSLFALATVTSAIQVDPDPGVRDAYRKRLGVERLDYSNRRMVELGESEGFSVFVLAEPLREYAEEHKAYLHGFPNTTWSDGHWNETGHRVVGEILAERIGGMLKGE